MKTMRLIDPDATIETHPDDWRAVTAQLGQRFAARAAHHDVHGTFVADNYRELRDARLFSVAIPAELGGGGAGYAELVEIVRELGRHCGSTALAYAMHSHPVAVNVYKYLRGDDKAAATLRKLAGGELAVAGTGANDWLESSGTAERVEGGYRVSAHKRFVSGAPGADVFVSSVHFAGPEGDEVLHFAAPFSAEGLTIVETWNTLGMRGTGSHDVVLDGLFVPDAAIVARRPAGVWHPMWNVILPTAMPLIVAAYLGQAEAAVECAVETARGRAEALAPVVGEMRQALVTAQAVHGEMVRANAEHGFAASLEVADATLVRKTIATEAVRQAVELAAELVGGPGFFRGHPVERIVRDVRAMHFHPLPARRQHLFSGRIALGLDPVAAA